MRALPRTLTVLSLVALATPAWAGLFGSKLPRVKNGEVVLKTGFGKPVTTYAERIPEMRAQSRVYDRLTRRAILARLTGRHLVNRDGKPLGLDDVQLYKVHWRDEDGDRVGGNSYSFIVDLGRAGQPGVAYRVHGAASAPELEPWLGRGTNPETISITVRHALTQDLTR